MHCQVIQKGAYIIKEVKRLCGPYASMDIIFPNAFGREVILLSASLSCYVASDGYRLFKTKVNEVCIKNRFFYLTLSFSSFYNFPKSLPD